MIGTSIMKELSSHERLLRYDIHKSSKSQGNRNHFNDMILVKQKTFINHILFFKVSQSVSQSVGRPVGQSVSQLV